MIYFLRQRHNKRSGWRKGNRGRQMLQPSTSSGYNPSLSLTEGSCTHKADLIRTGWGISPPPQENTNIDFFLQTGPKTLTLQNFLQPSNSKRSRHARRFGFRNFNLKGTQINSQINMPYPEFITTSPMFCWKSHPLL